MTGFAASIVTVAHIVSAETSSSSNSNRVSEFRFYSYLTETVAPAASGSTTDDNLAGEAASEVAIAAASDAASEAVREVAIAAATDAAGEAASRVAIAAAEEAAETASEESKQSEVPVVEPATIADRAQIRSEETRQQVIEESGTWLHNDSLTSNALELIEAITHIGAHGLNPLAYQLPQIRTATELFTQHVARMQTTDKAYEDSLAQNKIVLRYRLNTLFDTSFMKLVKHLGQGVVDGRDLQKRLYRDPPQVDAFRVLLDVTNNELSVNEALASVTPSHSGYRRLMQTMSELLAEQATGIDRTIVPSSANALTSPKPQHVMRLWKKLIETGDLDPKTTYPDIPDKHLLLTAIKSFQARHGLEQDGMAGINTLTAMNASVADDIASVAMSLERFRWLPRELGKRHIFVNIPDFRLSLVDNELEVLTMPTVVGEYQHQTPAFSRELSYMEYNPTWTVPASITNKKLIPSERKSPGYLVNRNFEFLKSSNGQLVEVPASSVTASDIDAETLPFVLRQRSGPGNALGRMKFMMPNKYAIYLHDTPVKHHFTQTHRAHSHGCIRLSEPEALARALMEGDGYEPDRIEESIQSQETHKIVFRQPIPTHLVYMTAWVDENQVLQKRPDVYGNNDTLLNELRELDVLPGALYGWLTDRTNL